MYFVRANSKGSKCHREEKLWPDQDSNPGPLIYSASTLPNELTSDLVVL